MHWKHVDARRRDAGPREGDEICLYESLAMLRHTPTGHIYLAFRETMDELMTQQTDPVKYPLWLFDGAGKRAERKILIARVLRRPADKDDSQVARVLARHAHGRPGLRFHCVLPAAAPGHLRGDVWPFLAAMPRCGLAGYATACSSR